MSRGKPNCFSVLKLINAIEQVELIVCVNSLHSQFSRVVAEFAFSSSVIDMLLAGSLDSCVIPEAPRLSLSSVEVPLPRFTSTSETSCKGEANNHCKNDKTEPDESACSPIVLLVHGTVTPSKWNVGSALQTDCILPL